MSKVSKIDQIHLTAVIICMSTMSKMGKEHTHTFLLITFLIFNQFSIRKKVEKLRLRTFQPYHQILCILKHVEDVEDKSNTSKGCNAMYVKDVEDSCCMLCADMSKTSKILKQAITDFYQISLSLFHYCQRHQRCVQITM